MSWYSKVAWSEGLFLRQHHLQQSDRHFEHHVESRMRHVTPYPWGFAEIEIDRDLAQQNKFALRRASGILPDGTPFDMPATSPLPLAIDVPDGSDRQSVWLTMPAAAVNGRELDMADGLSGSRYVRGVETIVDSAAAMHLEEVIEVAHPRIACEIRPNAKAGFHCLRIARILEVRDRTVLFEEGFAPPVIVTSAHPVVSGWLDAVIGWVRTRLETLARYAADPSSGGGLQTFDYFMLQLLNREIGYLQHLRRSRYVHPVRIYEEFLKLCGELSTFSAGRQAREFAPYDHDDLAGTFEPLLGDIQRLLSLDVGRAIRLDLVERAQNAFMAAVPDRSLFRKATFVVEVAAGKPLTQIQQQFPALCKLGPNTRMNEIVQTHLPGIELVHMPTPPRQIRAISTHVYFYLDRNSPLWPEFSVAPSIGLHFAGDWPELQLDLWAIVEDR